MDKNQISSVYFVQKPTFTRGSNQVAPMNNQQQFEKNIKQFIPNEQEQSSSENSNVKSTDNIHKGINFKPLLIVIGILFILVGLAAVITTIYLFILINKTATSTNTTVTTTTTSIASISSTTLVTTITNLPSQCYSYITIDDASRLTTTGSGTACDDYVFTSSPTWVRFNGTGGTQIPTTSPGEYCCGTYYSGWYDGTMPTFGATVSGPVCYAYSIYSCYWSSTIWVTNCDSFYVYGLVAPSICYARYCTTY